MPFTKTELSPEERLRVAYGHYILGIDQQHLSHLFAINSGRINEACKGLWVAMHDPKGVVAQPAAESPPAASPEAPRPNPVPVPWRPAVQEELPLGRILNESLDGVLAKLVVNGGTQ